MNIEIADYAAFFTFPKLEDEAVQKIQQAAQDFGLAVSAGSRHLEFDYNGRDTGRKTIDFLCCVAPLIGTAEGEAECVLTTDGGEKRFEFYAIKNFRLYREDAKLVKLPPVEVCLETSAPGLLAAFAD